MSPPTSTTTDIPADSAAIHILHIDDEPDFADLVATFLERERPAFTVHTETDPTEALATLKDGDIDLECVISDYDMPGLNGLELLEYVRKTDPDLPFILFTGKGSEEIASEAITAGVTEYLQKGGGTEQYTVLANRIQNVVEHYRAERHLTRGLEAIETAQEGIAILSEDGYIEYLNTAYAALLGYERDELIGSHWEILYREDDVDEVYDILLPAAKDGYWQGQKPMLKSDGTLLAVEHTLSYTADESLICTLSEPSVTEATDKECPTRARAMDKAPVGITITDPHTEDNPIIYVNEEFTELTGYSRDDVLGQNTRFLQGERTRERPVTRLRDAIATEKPVSVELRNYRKDGTEFWNRVRIAPLFDDDGEIEYYVGFQDDVTREKTYESKLRSQAARLEALLEHSPDMITIHDADGVIHDVNQRMCDELGYTEEELTGTAVWDIDPTADPTRARAFWESLPTNSPRRFEGELERADGTTVPVEIHLIRLNLDGKDRFVAMDRDISDQKQRQEELLERNERLDRFTSILSHDLRNPLQLAQGRLQLLKEDCESEHFDDIDYALTRMDALIEDVLTLAQVGNDAMEIESVSLSDLVEDCWTTVATDTAALEIETEQTIQADEKQLHQLFENLFRNAVEHADETVTVTVGDTETGFYIEDNGPGIPAAARDDIFDAGYTTADDGTGFGLHIVARVVDAHEWAVSITEGETEGARFEISTANT
ncbi:PAS domain S-box protein [Natronolimnobius sp. AArcel1]|uniref:PAS domain S-box protein n=1 Tax=Natronolimnobius sp. AArcel1 TaxID=1679093 RepID=UPI0013EDF305|nr:PAS domain S-box protein [Natronolimnobius sp. AArcel1]NGM70481.1 PAS domain S-box protein [Natronolimnobius sp. AArcel1]